MISRDEYGIIIQTDPNDPSYKDGGDSAARMGISALENPADRDWLFLFNSDTGLVRHPFQLNWNDPKLTSRDQLVQFLVGTKKSTAFVTWIFHNKLFINKDIILPDVRLYMYKCADMNPPLWLKILGNANMWLSLIWNTKLKPNEELNQFTCMCIRLGWSKRLIDWHPDIEGNIRSYWQREGYNRPEELGEILIRKLKSLDM